MGNSENFADFFPASVRLLNVSIALGKIGAKERIENKEDLVWGAHLLARMDFDSPYHHSIEAGKLAVLATNLRPGFYETQRMERTIFDKDLSRRVYQALITGGKKAEFLPEELPRVQRVFESLSHYALNEATR